MSRYRKSWTQVLSEVREGTEAKEAVVVEADYKYDGKVVKISKKNFSKVHKDYKNSTKGKETMLINDPKTNGTISVPVQFEEVDWDRFKIDESWKKGTYTITDVKTGKVLGKFKSGAKAQKAADDIFQKGDYDAISVEVDEEVKLDEKGTAYPATVDTLRKIVKDKQHQTVMFDKGQALVDLFSASAMVQVYDALKPATKKKFEDMIKSKEGFMKSQAFAMKMLK